MKRKNYGETLTIQLSPSENDLKEALGDQAVYSPLCEEYGADILFAAHNEWIGIQRKAVPHDFLKSTYDGRLTRETELLTLKCGVSRIVLEGKFRYWPDGHVASGTNNVDYKRFTKNTIQKIICEIETIKGIPVNYTDNLADTVRYIRTMVEFFRAEQHTLLSRRPSCVKAWGSETYAERMSWILQGFNGIGPGLAANILAANGGRVPLLWTIPKDAMAKVSGIGATRADKMYEILNQQIDPVSANHVAKYQEKHHKTMPANIAKEPLGNPANTSSLGSIIKKLQRYKKK